MPDRAATLAGLRRAAEIVQWSVDVAPTVTPERQNEVSRVKAALRLAEAELTWIPVTERLPVPEEGAPHVPVLFNMAGGGKHSVCAGRFMVGKYRYRWRSLQGLECTDLDVTHWKPMPEGPNG